MRIFPFAATFSALVLSASVVAAQQPAPPRNPHRQPGAMMGPGMAPGMRMMDSLNARLDTLLSRMNRATGDRKITAMADVINELVGQRRAMHEHMRGMMEPPMGRMHRMNQSAGADSTAADTTDQTK